MTILGDGCEFAVDCFEVRQLRVDRIRGVDEVAQFDDKIDRRLLEMRGSLGELVERLTIVASPR